MVRNCREQVKVSAVEKFVGTALFGGLLAVEQATKILPRKAGITLACATVVPAIMLWQYTHDCFGVPRAEFWTGRHTKMWPSVSKRGKR